MCLQTIFEPCYEKMTLESCSLWSFNARAQPLNWARDVALCLKRVLVSNIRANSAGYARLYEPRHDKMRLWESPTRPDTNRPAQLQRLARVLKFRL